MRKFLVRAIPIVTLVGFILIMFSVNFLKNPSEKGDNIPMMIENIIHDVSNENWEKVSEGSKDLERVWKKVVRRVQFSAERDELNAFKRSLARLRGAILAQDKSNALMELNEAHEHWKGLGN